MTMFRGGAAHMDNYPASQHDSRSWFVRAGRREMSYWRREDSQFGARNRYVTLWPPSGFMSGDLSAGYCPFGQDTAQADAWSPMQRASRGNSGMKFIRGQCKDGSGNALGGAVVQGFLTANDVFVSETTCDDKGNYELGTVYPAQNHYLVAYYASTNLAGTTVNTITPTNRDGT